MAEEFPIEPEYNRFVPSIGDPTAQTEEGEVEVEMPNLAEADIEELPDGSAIVKMPNNGPMENEDFYQNLADSDDFDPFDLQKLALKYQDLIRKDKESRKKRDEQYEEGIRRTGMGNDAPGGAQFTGASKVVHPVVAEACVDFAARAIKEMFPPDGPTRIKIPCAEFLPIDNVLLPFAAGNFYTAQRVTEIQDITQYEFKRRIAAGLYRDISLVRATAYPEETAPEKANYKVEGKEPDENEDGVRRVYHIYAFLEIEEDKYTKGEMAPYILMVDELENEVIGLYRNWEEGDESMTKLDWIVEFKFIPWRGAYAVGLPHLIGGLAAALTGSLRALLDSAHINNAATLLKLKGAKVSGQSQQVEITQVSEIEAAPGVDDVRKLAMPMPFNPPSPVLMELMGWLTNAAKGVVTTAEEKIADVNSQTPVGTTQALIEQGAAVFSSIHARLHESQRRVLMILGRINRWYLEDMKKGDVEDFQRNTDIVPVSDPHIFSETQRMAQTQAVMAIMQQNPDLFNRRAVISRFLKQIKVPGVNELMVDVPPPEKMDPANENVAMSIGQMAYAYPEQDHLAHIQSHLDFARDPVFGGNPLIAPQFIAKAMEHIKQHIVLWYLGRAKGYVNQAMGGKPHENYGMVANPKEIDKLYAMAAQHISMDTEQTLQGIMPVIQQMMQIGQQFQPQPQLTPDAKVLLDTSMAETQRRAARDQAEMQLKDREMAADIERETLRLQADFELAMEEQKYKYAIAVGDMDMKERIESARLTRDAARLKLDRDKTALELTKGV